MASPRRYIWKLIFLAATTILLGTAPSQAQRRAAGVVTGRILDAASREPLGNVNVFLTNTMIGAATDRNGRYEIKNIPFGQYEITVSCMGYVPQFRQVRIETDDRRIENFYLAQKILPGEEVTVTALDPSTRRSYLRIFKRVFLGASHKELNCRLINENALHFSFNDTSNVLGATADEPLLVENRALGYRITFLLENFSAQVFGKRTMFTFRGRPLFRELAPRSRKEMKEWRRNRLIAYHGSLRHFLAALATGRINESGFSFSSTSSPNIKMTALDIPKRPVFLDKILTRTDDANRTLLRFKDYLEVTYHFEGEPQKSWLTLNKKYAIIDTSGQIVEPFDPTEVRGKWAGESLTELLPRDFRPEQSVKTRPVFVEMERDYFQEGLALADSGKLDEALIAWRIGKEALALQAQYNPALAIAFIEQATANQARDFYEEACKIYYWSLSAKSLKGIRKTVAAEIERIAPLLDKKIYREWRRDLRKNRPRVLRKIKQFWLEKDPTPATILNERLIEHWERIAYARQHFNKGATTVYGTDDRGLIYIKYGKPDRQHAVTLGINQNEMFRWGAYRGEVQSRTAVQNAILSGQIIDRLQERDLLRKTINKFNYFPECEIWAYDDQVEEENTLYVFGPRGGKGAYGLRTGVEDLIPDNAFQRVRASEFKGILPGSILQLMFYNDLSAFDSQFADRFRELEDAWSRAESGGRMTPGLSYLKSTRKRYQNLDNFDAGRLYAPPDQSDIDEAIAELELRAFPARTLRNNQPKISIVCFAFPPVTASQAPADSQLSARADTLQFMLILRDESLNEIRRIPAQPFARNDLTSVFQIEHSPAYRHMSVSIQPRVTLNVSLLDQPPDHSIPIGKQHFSPAPPLDPDIEHLEMSDLLVGTPLPQESLRARLPFPLVPSRRFLRTDPMQVYFEVYHLETDKTGQHRFSLEFRVIRLETKGDKIKRKEKISSAFVYEPASPFAQETFGVSLANLNRGVYELEVEIRDQNSGEKKKRRIGFEVIRE